MKKLVISTLFVLQVVFVFGQSTGFTGKVIDSKTQKPLPSVVASIQNTSFTSLTDAAGVFTFDKLSSGSQLLQIKSAGYKEQLLVVEVVEGKMLDLGVVVLEEDVSIEQQINLISILENDLGDDNSGSENTAGLLQASRDTYQQAAAFNWGQARFRIRGLDNEYSTTIINGVSMNKLLDNRPQWGNWGGLNDATRNQEFTMGSAPSDYTFGGILGTQEINTRASIYRKGTRVSYAGTQTNYNWRAMATHASGMNSDGWAFVVSASRRWAEEAYFEGTDYSAVKALPEVERQRLAKLYEEMEENTAEAKVAYEQLSAEVDRLYDQLTKDMGINVEFVDKDPYSDHLEMMDDIETNKTLKVLETKDADKHPIWSNSQNDKFRAVHDAFGHAATGRGFDRHGEEAAYQAQNALTEGKEAKLALTTETQAYNAALITTGQIPVRKAGIIVEPTETKADPGAKLPTIPQMSVQPDTPQQEINETPVPVMADDDNLYSTTMSHHVSGGRVVAPEDIVVPTANLYNRLKEDYSLSPETRQMIYRAVISGSSIEDSHLDETNKEKYGVISHSRIIATLTSKGVTEDDELIDFIWFKNC
jgi:molecular chaperone GrpE (heat shock protein)